MCPYSLSSWLTDFDIIIDSIRAKSRSKPTARPRRRYILHCSWPWSQSEHALHLVILSYTSFSLQTQCRHEHWRAGSKELRWQEGTGSAVWGIPMTSIAVDPCTKSQLQRAFWDNPLPNFRQQRTYLWCWIPIPKNVDVNELLLHSALFSDWCGQMHTKGLHSKPTCFVWRCDNIVQDLSEVISISRTSMHSTHVCTCQYHLVTPGYASALCNLDNIQHHWHLETTRCVWSHNITAFIMYYYAEVWSSQCPTLDSLTGIKNSSQNEERARGGWGGEGGWCTHHGSVQKILSDARFEHNQYKLQPVCNQVWKNTWQAILIGFGGILSQSQHDEHAQHALTLSHIMRELLLAEAAHTAQSILQAGVMWFAPKTRI